MFIKITDEKGIPIDDSNPLAVRFIGLDASGTFNVNVVEPVPGRIAGPMSASGMMYFRGEGATTLKYIFVE